MLYYIVHTKKIIKLLVCTLFYAGLGNAVIPDISAIGRDTEKLAIDRAFK